MAESDASAKVRMYRLGELGDCFLLTFTVGEMQSRMLIDCGSFRNSGDSIARLQKTSQDIRKELDGKPLDVVVGTHQHNDHLSGFVHCEEDFRAIGVEEVWLSWLDDPQDRMARGIGETHNNLQIALYHGAQKLRGLSLGAKGARSLELVEDMLGFYGASGSKTPPALPAKAVGILRQIGRKKPQYLRPGKIIDVPGVPAGSVRAYVLGPPRDSKLLYRKDPRTGESYDPALAAGYLAATRFFGALTNHSGAASAEENEYPFSERYKCRGRSGHSAALRDIQRRYNDKGQDWRRIDDSWTEQAGALALFLDSFTNNSSLVLAIEPVSSGKVLLFAADAQTGNWLSWPDVMWERAGVSTDDLLARTVMYKVGHHASHNATLVAAFEKMTNPDLTALIPVDKDDPNIRKKDGWRMPARNLFKRLAEKTSNRVLRMDDENPPACDWRSAAVMASWKKVGIVPTVTPMYVELDVGSAAPAAAVAARAAARPKAKKSSRKRRRPK